MSKILVVDDEEKICFAFERFLKQKGHTPFSVSTAEEALLLIKKETPEIVFLDIRLPGQSGLELLKEIKATALQTMVVIMTAHGTMDTAIEAMRQGAYEYLTKPIDLDKVSRLIDRMLQQKEIAPLKPLETFEKSNSYRLIGNSRSIQDIYKMIGILTTNDVPVLIEGESGVGKELVARAIHFSSDRQNNPFVAINCGAMPESLLESELFGHEKGSFTGADTQKTGKFEHAARGTIFLDEIGDLQLPLQVKLLRVLQEKQIIRVGGLESIPLQARIITATNKNLAHEMNSGNFRSDLYYRLQLITLKIPPLRERKKDIFELVTHFIIKANKELGKNIQGIEKKAMEKLLAYEWPGNVRELENIIKRAIILTRRQTIGSHRIGDLKSKTLNKALLYDRFLMEQTVRNWFKRKDTTAFLASGELYRNIMDTVDKTLILEAMTFCRNNQVKASELLGINRGTLRKKIDRYKLTDSSVVR